VKIVFENGMEKRRLSQRAFPMTGFPINAPEYMPVPSGFSNGSLSLYDFQGVDAL
jgi:hypothetical protein